MQASQLKRFRENDMLRFPDRERPRPELVIVEDGEDEWEIEKIVDERTRGQEKQ